jgi:hypothetical protein
MSERRWRKSGIERRVSFCRDSVILQTMGRDGKMDVVMLVSRGGQAH